MKLNTWEKMRGYSLLELMIAMAIGMFLVGVIASVLTGGQTSMSVIEGSSRVQENARFGLNTVSRFIRNAGDLNNIVVANTPLSNSTNPITRTVRTYSGNTYLTSTFTSATGLSWVFQNFGDLPNDANDLEAAGEFIGGINNTANGTALANTDQIVLRLQAFQDNLSFGCAGTVLNGDTRFVVHIYVNTNRQLVCEQREDVAGSVLSSAILAEGIDDLQIEYALVNVTNTQTQYLNAAEVVTAAAASSAVNRYGWVSVKSVRLSLSINSIANALPTNVSRTIQLADGPSNTYNDRLFRATFSDVVMLRNKGT
jgi:hypothetical protein